jgi:hypothetical protein
MAVLLTHLPPVGCVVEQWTSDIEVKDATSWVGLCNKCVIQPLHPSNITRFLELVGSAKDQHIQFLT